jgi:hypothetical protein
MSISRLALMGAAGAGGAVAVEDAFSTDLYTGNGSTQTITNGIDLAGEGGLVWAKCRSLSEAHMLFDTGRGVHNSLFSNSSTAESTSTNTLTGFNSDGFSIGDSNIFNTSGSTNVAWTFRKAPKFFDVVTYTGDGNDRVIPHNLEGVPGCLFVKCRSSGSSAAFNWAVWHRSLASNGFMQLNTTDPEYSGASVFNTTDVPHTATTSSVGSSNLTNGSGEDYVAYLFAHNDAADGIIQCGSYTGNGITAGPEITLGWKPQWVIVRRTDSVGNWFMFDSARDSTNPSKLKLFADESWAEDTAGTTAINFLSTGFSIGGSSPGGAPGFNASGGTYIYMAIRAEGA